MTSRLVNKQDEPWNVRRLVCAMVVCCFSSTVQSQSDTQEVAGLKPLLPVLPPSAPRPLDGPDGSVASFIDSLKTNDAAFQVVMGQGRLLTLKQEIAGRDQSAVIAVGDPSVVEFQILPNPRLVRVIGLRPGVTDLSITTADSATVSLEVHVTYDLALLNAQLRQVFPLAHLRLAQLREHIVVEGQARSAAQVARIIEMIEAYLQSMQSTMDQQSQTGGAGLADGAESSANGQEDASGAGTLPAPSSSIAPGAPGAGIEQIEGLSPQTQTAKSTVINLIRVRGVQQVLLKVRVAELNRTAMREIGADVLGVDPDTGNIVGTQIGGATVSAMGIAGLNGLLGTATGASSGNNSAFGIFPSGDFQIIFRALRQNGLVKVLAEPNLITMSGHRANFLAGGEFPVPVPQSSGGLSTSVTVDFREFGVRLDFLPYVQENDRIRLSVTPEVSTVDFSLGTTLVVGGDPVPGLNTRRANTVVELAAGHTLAMAGLLLVEMDGQTNRIPVLGDLPYIGPLFSNTQHRRQEKELLVLVTPHLIQPMEEHEVPLLPGDCIEDPTDVELYLGNQFEGRLGTNHNSTIDYPFSPRRQMVRDRQHVRGPVGFGN